MEILLYTIKDRITSCKEGTVHQKREGVLAERGSPVPEWNYAKLAFSSSFFEWSSRHSVRVHILPITIPWCYKYDYTNLFFPMWPDSALFMRKFCPKPRLIAFLHPHFFFPLQVHTFIRSSGSPSTVTAEEGIGRNQ